MYFPPNNGNYWLFFFIWVTKGTILKAQMRGADLKWDHITLSICCAILFSNFLLDDIPREEGDKFEGFRWNCAEAR